MRDARSGGRVKLEPRSSKLEPAVPRRRAGKEYNIDVTIQSILAGLKTKKRVQKSEKKRSFLINNISLF
jgi:hypothetical protein